MFGYASRRSHGYATTSGTSVWTGPAIVTAAHPHVRGAQGSSPDWRFWASGPSPRARGAGPASC
ncbi:hypothetical protein B005_0314 [Nocardiopsis alba ATCC BAA-2165]|uniref:Uncharacterized protein n=1 Tax=Nocardiopsis alba (strain ATCC BAA-2165 / BE74) TaxID=1205910 RepID=J7LGI2_NOCAA|nr:hypothetical protein B005_0314 [Nocardiopsis alba ATCC BAA-2165]